MIKRLVVFADCDLCGFGFRVDIDTARTIPPAWDLMDVATDAIRGSLDYQDARIRAFGVSSVQENAHLCHQCTEASDREAGIPQEVQQ